MNKKNSVYSFNKAIFGFFFAGIAFLLLGLFLAWITPAYLIKPKPEISFIVILCIFGGIIFLSGASAIILGIMRIKRKFEFRQIAKEGTEAIGEFVSIGSKMQIGGWTDRSMVAAIVYKHNIPEKAYGTRYYKINFKFINTDGNEITTTSPLFYIKEEAERLELKKLFKIRYKGDKAVIID